MFVPSVCPSVGAQSAPGELVSIMVVVSLNNSPGANQANNHGTQHKQHQLRERILDPFPNDLARCFLIVFPKAFAKSPPGELVSTVDCYPCDAGYWHVLR